MNAIKYLLVGLMLASDCFGQVITSGGQRMAELIKTIEGNIPEGYRDPNALVEWGRWKKTPEFAQLQQDLQSGWPQALQNVEQIAPTNTSQTILFVAARGLDRESYIKFASTAVDLFRRGAIKDNRILKWALMPPEKHLRGFIGDEYQRPEIRRLLQEAKAVFASDKSFADMLPFIDGVLSGDVQRKYADFAARSESTPPSRSISSPGLNAPQLQPESHTTSAAPTPTTLGGQKNAAVVDRKASAWPWAVGGMLSLLVILAVAWKRRSS
jgi:hypothetical protein